MVTAVSENRAESAIWKKGILVQIQGAVWSMETKLEARDIDKAPSDIPEFVSLGKKRLFSTNQKNRFAKILGRSRASAERYGFAFPITGSFFVPFKNFDTLKVILESQGEKFYSEVDAFIKGYDERREEFLTMHEEHRAKLEEHYPEPETIRSKFNYTVMYYATSMAPNTNGTQSGDEMYLQFVMDSVNELREDARNVASSIKNTLKESKFDGRTERKVQTLIDKLTNMDLIEDSDLKSAAFRMAVEPTSENADKLAKAATNVSKERVRAVLLD
jgi:hypothetical protein